MKDTIDILTHIFSTIEDTGLHDNGLQKVDNIDFYTDGHYVGPGYVYGVEVFDDSWGDGYSLHSIVFDNNKKYKGTMNWINFKAGNGWFNDANSNWLDDDEITGNIDRYRMENKR